MSHILIVEDETVIRSALKRMLERNGYQISEAGSVQQARELLHRQDFALIISDLRLPGEPGTEMIHLAQGTPVLIMTSYASLRSAVDSMKLGAIDYIAKPFEHAEMLATIKEILDKQPAASTPDGQAKEQAAAADDQSGIIGSSAKMQLLFSQIRKVAPTDSNVLIHGESGTGKELVARALHRLSRRASSPIISVNCAAIPESLIESELFGHEKGAFTGADRARTGLVEAANGGTLFLDEIGELPLEAQARLLRVLQESEIRRVGSVTAQKVNIRLVAATHRDLKTMAQEGTFREDLYYRLHVIALQLPPLRERGADIIEIANALLKRQCQHMQRPCLQFSAQALSAISQYQWPGNVRELENAIERAVILCDGEHITTELLGIDASNVATSQDAFERFVLENQDSMTETELARQLGISRKNLWERRQKMGIPRKARKAE